MTTSCIIPFYNEQNRLPDVLHVLVQVPSFSEIICVDDGSDSPLPSYVRKSYPSITFLHHTKNKGKADAVQTGLNHAKGEQLLLLDADLIGLQAQELEKGIQAFLTDSHLDMLIFKSTHPYWSTRLSRHDILFSGTRMMKLTDLTSIFHELKPKRYELEIAINTYMIKQAKKVRFIPYSAANTIKTHKIGLVPGIQENVKMLQSICTYQGVENYLKQIFFFGHEQIQS